MIVLRVVLALIAAVAIAGCKKHDATTPTGPGPATVRWLCAPGRSAACDVDLRATEFLPDGSQRIIGPRETASRSAVDCFYVYPTIDMSLAVRNNEDVDVPRALRTAIAQVGRFSEVCSLWAPIYRQVSIGTYLRDADVLEHGLALAYADVERSFDELLAQAPRDRKIVVIGHSQGGQMVTRLLQRRFETDAALRARLLLAMVIGASVVVPEGATRGGTFQTLPLCTRPLETGCVIAYRTHEKGSSVSPDRWAPPARHVTACVNPASLDAPARRRFTRAIFPRREDGARWLRGTEAVQTSFVAYPELYAGECVDGPDGYRYLAVSLQPDANDRRKSPFSFSNQALTFGKLGLHLLDMQFAQDDLIGTIERRVTAER